MTYDEIKVAKENKLVVYFEEEKNVVKEKFGGVYYIGKTHEKGFDVKSFFYDKKTGGIDKNKDDERFFLYKGKYYTVSRCEFDRHGKVTKIHNSDYLEPMTHKQALTFKSKMMDPSEYILKEIKV